METVDSQDRDDLIRPIGDLAHDIRTPLAIVRTNAEVMLLDTTLPPGPRAMLQDMIAEIDKASALLSEFVAAAKKA